jgi:hypothetical protein
MNSAELKLELFRKIDNLPMSDLELVYKQVVQLIDSNSSYKLSTEERQVIQEAIDESNEGKTLSHGQVVEEARNKYGNLNFK